MIAIADVMYAVIFAPNFAPRQASERIDAVWGIDGVLFGVDVIVGWYGFSGISNNSSQSQDGKQ